VTHSACNRLSRILVAEQRAG